MLCKEVKPIAPKLTASLSTTHHQHTCVASYKTKASKIIFHEQVGIFYDWKHSSIWYLLAP